MVSSTRLAEFALASFILIVIPGPSVLFVVGRALAHGRRVALASVVGNALGVYVVAACVAFGLGSIVQRSELAFTALKTAGALYLIWLGVQAIRHRRSLSDALIATGSDRGAVRAAREGFVVGVANPKVFILFGAILPQFVDRSAGHVSGQMLILSLVSFVIAVASDSIWAVGASAARSWFANSPKRLGMVGGIGGLAMIGVGVTVLGAGRRTELAAHDHRVPDLAVAASVVATTPAFLDEAGATVELDRGAVVRPHLEAHLVRPVRTRPIDGRAQQLRAETPSPPSGDDQHADIGHPVPGDVDRDVPDDPGPGRWIGIDHENGGRFPRTPIGESLPAGVPIEGHLDSQPAALGGDRPGVLDEQVEVVLGCRPHHGAMARHRTAGTGRRSRRSVRIAMAREPSARARMKMSAAA